MLSRVYCLYAYDMLRADGYPVRFARLGMLEALSPITALCWVMELAFYVAYYDANVRVKFAAILGFWCSYLAILCMIG